MSETKETKPEVTQPVASEGGEMKMKSKPKPKKFKATKEEPVKIDLSKVDTSLEANAKVEAPIKVDLTEKKRNRCHSNRRNRDGGCGRTNRRWQNRGHWRNNNR